MVWIDLYKPTEAEFESVAEEFELPPQAVDDAIEAHQRPKLVRYGDSLFVVLKTARYLDEPEKVEFSEVHIFLGKDFIITVCHGEALALDEVRRKLESEKELLRRGPEAILRAILVEIVDDYGAVVEGLETDIEEIEAEVFSGNSAVSRRIYELSRELVQFQQATKPLVGALERLTESNEHGFGPELRRYLHELHDDVLRVTEPVEGFRETLSNILVVNLTMISVRQNDQTEKISAWAAILVVPTIVTGIYGMNFEHMPELSWKWGFWWALGLMAFITVAGYLWFRARDWL
jgi:magnesium transporter